MELFDTLVVGATTTAILVLSTSIHYLLTEQDPSYFFVLLSGFCGVYVGVHTVICHAK